MSSGCRRIVLGWRNWRDSTYGSKRATDALTDGVHGNTRWHLAGDREPSLNGTLRFANLGSFLWPRQTHLFAKAEGAI
jgi:hypothetical protein